MNTETALPFVVEEYTEEAIAAFGDLQFAIIGFAREATKTTADEVFSQKEKQELQQLVQILSSKNFVGTHLEYILGAIAILDEVIKDYLSVFPDMTNEQCLYWFSCKFQEAKTYLLFLEARRPFIHSLDKVLPAVSARLCDHSVEVEAGKFSLRDVKICIPKVYKELAVYVAQ